ncbi:HNH endonuclease signature motif containing protein, partial [Mycobacterium sp. E787]|uniref:HNH endonuclease signature motif containing protein n=1 Tax=Mycobacterium sp. E787 TaxID=1834150 RepID=UPI000A506CC5
AEWKRDRANGDGSAPSAPPMPGTLEAFLRLVEAGWDAEATRRPHAQHTTVVAHYDAAQRAAALHLGPLLSDADRQYLTCDAGCEVWLERAGQPLGAGRTTRTISRRLRRALEHRHPSCAVPGCGATRGLHAHHLVHWENGGPTELTNLILICPYHHRQHHQGHITITGPPDHLSVTDEDGQPLHPGSLAHPKISVTPFSTADGSGHAHSPAGPYVSVADWSAVSTAWLREPPSFEFAPAPGPA